MVDIKSKVEEHREFLFEMMHFYELPIYMHGSLVEYIMEGRPVGGFLKAVLENNLSEAVNRADNVNQEALVRYVKFLHNKAPSGSWGREGACEYWRKRGGLKKVFEDTEAK